jgi:hypothetical protein
MGKRMSKIFTNLELKTIEERKAGDKSDKMGLFHNRIKPKITELLEVWFNKKQELEELVKKN